MFVPAKISIREINLLQRHLLPHDYVHDTSDDFYRSLIAKCTHNGILDGSNLGCLTFPFKKQHYDVFISYSHNDEDTAQRLYGFLVHKGLSVFLDSTVWNSADRLLKVIDDKYSWSDVDPGYYDYVKRNFSTSHVHTMLSMAMLEAIRRSELCLFIESDNSVTLEEGIKEQTLSPWIYAENLYIRNIKPELPERYKRRELRTFSEGGIMEQREIQDSTLKVKYNLNLANFIQISAADFNVPFYGTPILDRIYRRKGVIQEIREING